MNHYLKTIFSVFQLKSTEYLVEEVSSSTEISWKNIFWGSLFFCLLSSLSFLIVAGPLGLIFVGPSALMAFISAFIGIFVNAAITLLVLKLAKSPIEYKKLVNLFSYFISIAGVVVIFGIIPLVGTLLVFIASLGIYYIQLKSISDLSGVTIGKLFLLQILCSLIIGLLSFIILMFVGFASFFAFM